MGAEAASRRWGVGISLMAIRSNDNAPGSSHTPYEAISRLPVRQFTRLSAVLLVSTLAATRSVVAQSTTSLIPDATVLPKRAVGFRVLTSWTRYDQLIGVGPGHNIAASLSTDSLGSALEPRLAAAEAAIRTLSDSSNFRLTAGNLVAIGNSRIVTAPLIMQYGLTSRLTLGVVVPLIEARTTLYAQLNPHPGLANVGPNPAFASPEQLARNAALVSSFRSAATTLQQRLTDCQANPSGEGCATLIGKQAEALGLIQTTSAFSGAIETLYGTGETHPGQPLVPIAGGSAQLAIEARIKSLQQQYQALLGTDVVAGSVVAAGGPGAREAFQSLLTSAGRDTLQRIDRSGIGDVSIGATYQLANTFGDTSAAAARATRYRLALNGTFRVGTGQPANRNRLLDLGTGYGQHGVEVGGAGDIQFGTRYSATASASYAAQLGTIDVARLPNPGNALLPLDVAPANRGGTFSAGNVLALTFIPRIRVSGYFAITGQYALVRTGADRYTVAPDTAGGAASNSVLPAGIGASAATAQQVGFGFSYSTVVGRDRGPGRLPFEASFTHIETMSASGGPIAKTFRDQIELRVFFLQGRRR